MTPWSLICPVNPQPIIAWYAESCASEPVRLGRRGHELPIGLCMTVMAEVVHHIGGKAHGPFLGYSVPGHFAPMHTDPQRDDWLTRVHVPLITNPGCWMAWENDAEIEYACGRCGKMLGRLVDGVFKETDAVGDVDDTVVFCQCGAWRDYPAFPKVHFEVGNAYSFDTLTPHAVGNDGDTERVHLIFEVLRG